MRAVATQTRIRLKKGKERPVLQRHHWIFSGAIESFEGSPGELAEVFSSDGKLLGTAIVAAGPSIIAHMLAFGNQTPLEALEEALQSAVQLRSQLFDPTQTNAYRLINAEGDGIPGLIVDSYADVLVIQCSHPGIETLKQEILSLLIEHTKPKAIYEKSTSSLRKKEGLEEIRTHLYGADIPEVEILENGLHYSVQLLDGQKTGLFLDQREMRALVRTLSNKKRVLNCFAYTGGFSIAALAGGATHVDSVEISKKCEPACNKNLALNQLSAHQFIAQDALKFVAEKPLDYDLVILDPPAFAKSKKHIDSAFKAYKELNRAALAKMPPGSLLLTCSCSYYISEELFQNILFRAALESGRKIQILSSHRDALDHPHSIFHPETSYLKSLLLYIAD